MRKAPGKQTYRFRTLRAPQEVGAVFGGAERSLERPAVDMDVVDSLDRPQRVL